MKKNLLILTFLSIVILFSGCSKNQTIINDGVNQNTNIVSQQDNEIEFEPMMSSLQCVSVKTIEQYKQEFLSNRFGDMKKQMIDNFFGNERVLGLFNNSVTNEICFIEHNNLSFVFYGEYENDNNNALGTYDEKNELQINYVYNPDSGDIGLCSIDGHIEENILFSCGGGDAGYGFNKVYILDKNSNEAKVIKDCEFAYDDDPVCEINTLNL